MKRFLLLSMSLYALGTASASASLDLAKAKNCMACHSVQAKLVGPAFKVVAGKYASEKDAEAKLIAKVLKGSTGTWGPMSMPPNPQVSEADAKTLVKWILAQ